MEAIKQKLGAAEIDHKLRYFVTYLLSLDFFKGRWVDRCVCEAIQSSSSFTTFIKNLNRICDFNYSADAEKIKSLVGQKNIFISNHPSGMYESFIELDMLLSRKIDVYCVANPLANYCPYEVERYIYVDILNPNAKNREEVRQRIISLLNQNKSILIFPAGTVASFDLRQQKIVEHKWKKGIFEIAKICDANIIPLCVRARNSSLYYISRLFMPLLVMLLHYRELFLKSGKTSHIEIGEVITAQEARQLNVEQLHQKVREYLTQ